MAVMILDPALEKQVRAEYEAANPERPAEVWEGMTVVPPLPNNEHARLTLSLCQAFAAVIDWTAGDQALPGGNVSDRDDGWAHNYRNPDVLVAFAGGRAVDNDTHWTGGPDLVVEIISPGEDPQAKFDFYAGIGVREVMIVDRHPWAVELYRLQSGVFTLVGRAEPATGVEVSSGVLPLAFRLGPGRNRPVIGIRHTGTGQTWAA